LNKFLSISFAELGIEDKTEVQLCMGFITPEGDVIIPEQKEANWSVKEGQIIIER
jgi:hypothetical protein